MKNILLLILVIVAISSSVFADTIYLKNGSVIKGTLVGFESNLFIFRMPNGKVLRFPADEVSKLDMDQKDSGSNPVNDDNGNTQPTDNSPTKPSNNPDNNPSKGGGQNVTSTVDVRLEEQWIRTQIQVNRGDRVQVQADGSILLEGKTNVGPDGLNGRFDPNAPLTNANDGALLASVGQEADAPIYVVGRSSEFISDREGLLYFTVNHGNTDNARGTFRVTVTVERNAAQGGGGSGAQTGNQKTVRVNANQPWTDTGINVQPNMTFEIIADGEIELGNRVRATADGNQNATSQRYPVPNASGGALIAKIRYKNGRDSQIVFIGARGGASTEANEFGRLLLGINDEYFNDNKGYYTVLIRW